MMLRVLEHFEISLSLSLSLSFLMLTATPLFSKFL
jgi:hypothetical protein